MKILTIIPLLLGGATMQSVAANDFSFERPGFGVSVGITPVAQVSYEQALNLSYLSSYQDQAKVRSQTWSTDVLLRTGLAEGWEAQIGWQGAMWSKSTAQGKTHSDHGYGDTSLAVKKAIDLPDDNLKMALIARVTLPTGDDQFSIDDEIYSLGSGLSYQFSDDINTSMSMYYALQNNTWSVTAVPTLTYALNDKWSGFSELVYSKAESQAYAYSLGSGLIYSVNDHMQFDASVGVALDGQDDNYQAGLGFAVLF